MALATPDVWFVGRLATYRYYNMDQIVGQALATFRRINEAVPCEADSPALKRMQAPAALAS
jgi:UDP-galactopyranose mutase